MAGENVSRAAGRESGVEPGSRPRAELLSEAERLCASLLSTAAAEPDWRSGMRAALLALFEYAEREPLAARALLIEAPGFGDSYAKERQRIVERLTRAVDGARREIKSRQSPSPKTSLFIVTGIERAVGLHLVGNRNGPIEELLPDLMHFAVLPYFGEKAAWAEHDAARALVAERHARRESGQAGG